MKLNDYDKSSRKFETKYVLSYLSHGCSILAARSMKQKMVLSDCFYPVNVLINHKTASQDENRISGKGDS